MNRILQGFSLPRSPSKGTSNKRQLASSSLLSLMLSLVPLGIGGSRLAGTDICGLIVANSIWSMIGSPYRLCAGGVQVPSGITLNIQAGVVVEAAPGSTLSVNGQLLAVGSANQPVLITGASKSPGSWNGIDVGGFAPLTSRPQVSLTYVTIEYGGESGGENLQLTNSDAMLSNVTVQSSGKHGLKVGSGATLLSEQLRLLNNGVGADGFPLVLGNIDTSDTQYNGIEISGNGVQAIALEGGGITIDQTWESLGVPYRVIGSKSVAATATLILQPGVELEFEPFSGLAVLGSLHAIGLPLQGITLTGAIKQPGSWMGVNLSGGPLREAAADMDYVTLEYGGRLFANLNVSLGRVVAQHSAVRYSSQDGLRVGYLSSLSIESSQIEGNAGYGVYMDDTADTAIAANNWWGAASGPQVDGGCNPTGSGAHISNDVIFRPFLTTATPLSTLLQPSDTSLLTITPERWFAEVSASQLLTLNVSLRDGNGQPLANRKLQYSSSLNLIEGDETTDSSGTARIHLLPALPGENSVRVSLLRGQCESGRSAQTSINITQPATTTSPLSDYIAPYINPNVHITPLPIVVGITTHLSINFKNPFTEPITLTTVFEYATAGIGVPFTPFAIITGTVIRPGESIVIGTDWVPPLGGHICINIRFGYRKPNDPPGPGDDSGGPLGSLDGIPLNQRFKQQHNLTILSSPFKPKATNDLIQFLEFVDDLKGSVGFLILAEEATPVGFLILVLQNQVTGNWWDFVFDTTSQLNCMIKTRQSCKGWGGPAIQYPFSEIGDLLGDPPSQDYHSLVPLETLSYPPAVASPNVPAARAAAINAVLDAQITATTRMVAAMASFDRAAGAAEANDRFWNDVQMTAYLEHLHAAADAMILTADRLDALIAELKAEGYADLRPNQAAFSAYQQRLATQGFTPDEMAAAHGVGMNDAQIEAIRQQRLQIDPTQVSGSAYEAWHARAQVYRLLGQALKNTPTLIEVAPARGRALSATATAPSARLSEMNSYFTLGNPFTHTETISLSVRRVNVPSDWIVSVSPLTVTLASSATVPATITIIPGSAMPQGSAVRIAVEGNSQEQLLGGYVVDVLVPQYTRSPATTILLPIMFR